MTDAGVLLAMRSGSLSEGEAMKLATGIVLLLLLGCSLFLAACLLICALAVPA